MNVLLTLVGFILGGLFGWFAHTFIGDALAEFRKLRGEGYNAFLSSVDIDPQIDGGAASREAKRQELREAKRRLITTSTALATFNANNHWLSNTLSRLGYDVSGAANALRNFSEFIDMENTDADGYFTQYKQALRFPKLGIRLPSGQW